MVTITTVSWLDEIYWDSLDDEGLKCQMGRYDGEVGVKRRDVIGVCFFFKGNHLLAGTGSHLK